MAIGTYISIITLNVNGLNAPTKWHRLVEWIQKTRPIYMLSRLVITFLSRSKHLLISWLQSPSAVITFKVIIDIYVPIAIFLIVWVDFVDLFSPVVFLDYTNPFNICCTAGLVYWILLTFACLKSFLFLHQFWMRPLSGTVILVVDFSLSIL